MCNPNRNCFDEDESCIFWIESPSEDFECLLYQSCIYNHPNLIDIPFEERSELYDELDDGNLSEYEIYVKVGNKYPCKYRLTVDEYIDMMNKKR